MIQTEESIMKKMHIAMLIVAIGFAALIGGCKSSEKITRTSQLPTAPTEGNLKVLMHDSTLYELQTFALRDSLLVGSGNKIQEGRIQKFSGVLNIHNIAYIQSNTSAPLKDFIAAGAAVFFVGTVASYLGDFNNKGLAVTEHQNVVTVYTGPINGGGGGGWGSGFCCPLVYSHEGSSNYLESETFAGAVFKGAERTAFDVLHHAQPDHGKLMLTVTDEGQETEYTNEMKILSVDAPNGVTVIPDFKGAMHTISQKVEPVRCIDFAGTNRLDEVLNQDERYWQSDLNSNDFTQSSGLRDGLILEFRKPAAAKVAKIVVTGTNTRLAVFAFEHIFKMKGENRLQWYQRLENDPVERMKFVRFMLREGMLRVSVWHGDKWVEQAAIVDVGPLITKPQVALLDLNEVGGDTVKIKLECTTDLWKIDQVYLDCSSDADVTVHEFSPTSAITDDGRDVSSVLAQDDDQYYAMMLGQSAKVLFDIPPAAPGINRTYILKTKGYYHQWFDSHGEDHVAEVDRILAEPMYGSKVFLPLWKEQKANYR
jgi:hypothetical protein